MIEALSKEKILEGLPTRIFGRQLFYFDEIDSTNTCARTLAETGAAEGTVVWADFQTAGKGRLGRAWIAEPGLNLTFSVILRSFNDRQMPWVPYYVAEAVAGGIEKTIDRTIHTKWPNDLLLEDRKICGMLLEGNDDPASKHVIAGIGINVNQASFPPPFRDSTTSLLNELGSAVDRIALFHNIVENMESLFPKISSHGDADILTKWKARCTTFGQQITVRTGSETLLGKAIGLSPDGGLLLETSEGLRTLFAGEVTLAAEHPGTTTL